MFRIGLGQDSHRFSLDENRKLILGGVEIKGGRGVESTSDGDVVIHALCNALEQAIGGDSFSVYADPMCREGITDSQEYLKVALQHIKDKGYAINNLGISVEAKRPKILPIADKIRKSLAKILQIEKEKIGINSTSGDGLTAFGRGEGIQVWAVAMLVKKA